MDVKIHLAVIATRRNTLHRYFLCVPLINILATTFFHVKQLIIYAKTEKDIHCDAGNSNSVEIFVQNFRHRAIG